MRIITGKYKGRSFPTFPRTFQGLGPYKLSFRKRINIFNLLLSRHILLWQDTRALERFFACSGSIARFSLFFPRKKTLFGPAEDGKQVMFSVEARLVRHLKFFYVKCFTKTQWG